MHNPTDDPQPIKHCPCCKFFGLDDKRPLRELLAVYETNGLPTQRSPKPARKQGVAAKSEPQNPSVSEYESTDSEMEFPSHKHEEIFDIDLNECLQVDSQHASGKCRNPVAEYINAINEFADNSKCYQTKFQKKCIPDKRVATEEVIYDYPKVTTEETTVERTGIQAKPNSYAYIAEFIKIEKEQIEPYIVHLQADVQTKASNINGKGFPYHDVATKGVSFGYPKASQEEVVYEDETKQFNMTEVSNKMCIQQNPDYSPKVSTEESIFDYHINRNRTPSTQDDTEAINTNHVANSTQLNRDSYAYITDLIKIEKEEIERIHHLVASEEAIYDYHIDRYRTPSPQNESIKIVLNTNGIRQNSNSCGYVVDTIEVDSHEIERIVHLPADEHHPLIEASNINRNGSLCSEGVSECHSDLESEVFLPNSERPISKAIAIGSSEVGNGPSIGREIHSEIQNIDDEDTYRIKSKNMYTEDDTNEFNGLSYETVELKPVKRTDDVPGEPQEFQVGPVNLRHVEPKVYVSESNPTDDTDFKSINELVNMFERKKNPPSKVNTTLNRAPNKQMLVEQRTEEICAHQTISKSEDAISSGRAIIVETHAKTVRGNADLEEIESQIISSDDYGQWDIVEALAEQMSDELANTSIVFESNEENPSPPEINTVKVESNENYIAEKKTLIEPILINPSVIPFAYFKSTEDVPALRKAMQGIGTDEATLIAILCRRTNIQLKEIQCKYLIQYGRDLFKDVRSETSGYFREVLCFLLMPRPMFYVAQLHDAIRAKDFDALIEILCALSYDELMTKAVKQAYLSNYKRSVEDDITDNISCPLGTLFVDMCSIVRDEFQVDPELVCQDTLAMISWTTSASADRDECLFAEILKQRSFSHIRAISQCCMDAENGSLLDLVVNNFKGYMKDALAAIVVYASDRPYFFATRLHKSMAGLGTTDTQLIRVMVMRCEIDLAEVAVEFQRAYGKSLASFIKGDTSGDYCRALLALLGEI